MRLVRRSVGVAVIAVAGTGAASVVAATGIPHGQAPDVMRLSSSVDGAAVFTGQAIVPGATQRRCIVVSNDSPVAARLFLYGTGGHGALGAHARLTVEGGDQGMPVQPGSCSGFLADVAAPLYDGRLAAFPAGEDDAIIDPVTTLAGAPRAFRLTVTIDDADTVQGLAWSGQAFRFGAEPSEPIARPQAKKVPVERDPDPEPTPAPSTPTSTRPTTRPAPQPVAAPLDVGQVVAAASGAVQMQLVAPERGRVDLDGYLTRGGTLRKGRAHAPRPSTSSSSSTKRAAAVRKTLHVQAGNVRISFRVSRQTIRRVLAHPGRYAMRLRVRFTGAHVATSQRLTVRKAVLTTLARQLGGHGR
jgi:hypothetical protein